jgi:hypothetical protein
MWKLLAVCSLVGALAACSLPTADKESDAMARQLYEEIRTGADLSKDPNLGPELKTPEALEGLAEYRPHVPQGAPTKIENRSWKYNVDNGESTALLEHAYIYPGGTVLVETTLQKHPGQKAWSVVGFHAKVEPKEGGTPGVKT